MGSGAQKRILFIVNHPIEDGSARYWVYQYLPFLQSAGYECCVRPFSSPTLYRLVRSRGHMLNKIAQTLVATVRRIGDVLSSRNFDLVVIHREAFPFFMPWMENRILNRQPNVVFSFDDAVFAGHNDAKHLNHPLLYKLKYGSGVNDVLRRSKAVIVGNATLAEYATRHNKNVHVIPTVVDLDRYRLPIPRQLPAGRVRVGWFGSNTTSSFLNIVLPALRKIAETHGERVEFRFFGDPNLSFGLPRARYLPFQLESEIEDLSTIDVGLMPMPDTVWTRGKCAFKAIQYMALGAPPVVSPVGMATELVQNGVNGYLASSVEEWYLALDTLIREPETWVRLSRAARATIVERYSLQTWSVRFQQVLDDVLRGGMASQGSLFATAS